MIDLIRLLGLQGELFLLMAAGFYFRRRVLSEEFQRGLTDLLMDLILPCNIITSFQIELTPELLNSSKWVLILSFCVQLISITAGFLLFRRSSAAHLPALKFGMLCSNSGFLGTPVSEGIWGAQGVLLTAIFLIPQRILMWSVGVSYFHEEKDNIVLKLLKNHCIDAVLIGMALMAFQIRLPGILNSAISTFGKCNTGLSMFLIGMIASKIRLRDFVDREILWCCFVRLLVIPAAVLLLCRLTAADAVSVGVNVILTAMPVGGITAMLAARYDRDPEFAVGCVATSTVLSMVTIPLWAMLL